MFIMSVEYGNEIILAYFIVMNYEWRKGFENNESQRTTADFHCRSLFIFFYFYLFIHFSPYFCYKERRKIFYSPLKKKKSRFRKVYIKFKDVIKYFINKYNENKNIVFRYRSKFQTLSNTNWLFLAWCWYFICQNCHNCQTS